MSIDKEDLISYARVCLWIAFIFFSLLIVITIPICYINDHFMQLINSPVFPGWLRGSFTSGLFYLLTVDSSGATHICIIVFISVLLSYFEHHERFININMALNDRYISPRAIKNESALSTLFSHINSGKDKKSGLAQFEEQLYWDTRLEQYESYLVALGLIGTLLAFYLGFAKELEGGMSFVNLDAVATNLLMVVGTAAISSISGIGLGMLGVRPLGDNIVEQVRNITNTAMEKIDFMPDKATQGPEKQRKGP